MDYRMRAKLHAALGSELRLQMIDLISSRKEMCVCELVDELGMSQANISRHVSVLRDAGVLRDRKLGTWVLLSVDEDVLDEMFGELVGLVRANHRASAREDVEARLEQRCGALTP